MIKLINNDCLIAMKDIPNESIDLIVTDPPYLIDYKTNHRIEKQHDFCSVIQNDNNPQLISAYIKECHRIMKNDTAIYMFCSFDKVDFFKQELEKYFNIKNMIVWVKNNHTAGDLEAQFGKKYELLLLGNKGRALFNGERITDVWNYDRVVGNEQQHQNQKPIDLLTQCIQKHSKKGEVVFDGFMGSGSTGVAAIRQERNFIGIEIEPRYFEIAENRIMGEKGLFNEVMFE